MPRAKPAAKRSGRVKAIDLQHSPVVANNNVARLMFYVNCICDLLDDAEGGLSEASNELRDYEHWYMLPSKEHGALLSLCDLLSPGGLEGQLIFQQEDLCGDEKKYQEKSAVGNHLVVGDTLTIGERTLSIRKVLIYKSSWLEHFYFEPLQHLRKRRGLYARSRATLRRLTMTRARSREKNSTKLSCVIL